MIGSPTVLTPSRAVISLRPKSIQSRLFSITSPSRSVLFNLGGLAASREGQYLSRESGIPRTEYSANIHLIRSSEVDPFAPAPGATKQANRRSAPAAPPQNTTTTTTTNNNQKNATSPIRLRQVDSSAVRKTTTIEALVEEHKQTKAALRNLQATLDEVCEAANINAKWEKTATAVLFTLLLVLLYRNYNLGEELELILKHEVMAGASQGPGSEAAVAPASEALPEELPAVIPVVPEQIVQESGYQQSGGVLQWLRSSLWASGGR